MTRAAWGKAKLEIFTLKQEIISLVKEGKNLNEIFDLFNSAGKLTANKSVFYRHASLIRNAVLSSDPLALPPAPTSISASPVPSAALTKPQTASGDLSTKPKPNRFVHDGVSDPEKLKEFF